MDDGSLKSNKKAYILCTDSFNLNELKILQINDVEPFEKAKGESETLAGFILEIAQQLPVFGQKIFFEKILFTVELVDQKRIKQVKVTLP